MKNIHLAFDATDTGTGTTQARVLRPRDAARDAAEPWRGLQRAKALDIPNWPTLPLQRYEPSESSGFADTVIEPTLVDQSIDDEPVARPLAAATAEGQRRPPTAAHAVEPAPLSADIQAPTLVQPAVAETAAAAAAGMSSIATAPEPTAPADAATDTGSATPAMPAGSNNRPRIGDLLVQSARLSGTELRDILQLQAAQKGPFGEIAVKLGYVEWTDVGWALSQQGETAQALIVQARSSVGREVELVMAYQPHSAAAHVIREICSQVVHATRPGTQGRRACLGIVSVGSGDGRTYLASNLALALAQMGRRTLLIEADMRRPRLQTLLPGLARSAGLSGVLGGRQRLAEAIVMPTGLPNAANCFVLPAGEVLRDPLELLQQASFNVLMQKVAGHFDHVLIDTPPVSDWVDARLVSAQAGAALLVARPDHNRMDDLDRLMRSFTRSGAGVAGVVMNARR